MGSPPLSGADEMFNQSRTPKISCSVNNAPRLPILAAAVASRQLYKRMSGEANSFHRRFSESERSAVILTRKTMVCGVSR